MACLASIHSLCKWQWDATRTGSCRRGLHGFGGWFLNQATSFQGWVIKKRHDYVCMWRRIYIVVLYAWYSNEHWCLRFKFLIKTQATFYVFWIRDMSIEYEAHLIPPVLPLHLFDFAPAVGSLSLKHNGNPVHCVQKQTLIYNGTRQHSLNTRQRRCEQRHTPI